MAKESQIEYINRLLKSEKDTLNTLILEKKRMQELIIHQRKNILKFQKQIKSYEKNRNHSNRVL